MTVNANKQQTGRARGQMFAWLACLCVSLVIQPCAVAAINDADCLHKATSAVTPTDPAHHKQGHQQQHEQHTSSAHCAELAEHCCDLNAVTIDNRSELLDLSTLEPPAAAVNSRLPFPATALPLTFKHPGGDPPDLVVGSRIPHRTLHCVYRD